MKYTINCFVKGRTVFRKNFESALQNIQNPKSEILSILNLNEDLIQSDSIEIKENVVTYVCQLK